jgi:nucleotide-binding universal stress UspA family protein
MAYEIVLGYDGSACAKEALKEAAKLAKLTGGHVTAAFGYEPKFKVGGEMEDHRKAIEAMGEGACEDALGLLLADGVDVDAIVVADRPAEALVQVAEDRGASMIVVGTHGEGPIRRLLIGSVAHRLLEISPVPVLVVRSGACSLK